MSVSTGCVWSIMNWGSPYDTSRISVDNTLLLPSLWLVLREIMVLAIYTFNSVASWRRRSYWNHICVIVERITYQSPPPKPSKSLCQRGTLVAQPGGWLLGLFFYCKRLRLWSFSKERGRHPRWSSPGVAARRGNPGQESRNQGGRVHERVSGETFSPPHCSVRPPLGLRVLLILCLSLAVCRSVLVVAHTRAAPTTSSWLCMWPRVCVCMHLWLFVTVLQPSVCFTRLLKCTSLF